MRISIIITFCCLIASELYSQTEKDGLVLGTNALIGSFSNNKQTAKYGTNSMSSSLATTSQFDFTISPSIGKFVINNLLVGVSPTILISKTKSETNNTSSYYAYNKSNSQSYGLGVFTEYYIGVKQGSPTWGSQPHIY